MSKKRLHTKRTTLHFFVGNERFPLLLGTNNALRIFMVLSETKSALVIKISQRYCLFTVWNSDLFSICFFGRIDFLGGGYITKISGNMTPVSGNMTSGEMTLGRLDRLPVIAQVILYNAAENFIHKFLWLFNKFHWCFLFIIIPSGCNQTSLWPRLDCGW